MALLAVLFYRYPARNLTVIGVTGTDGKTTTVNLIYHLLSSAGLKTAMISTVGAKIGKKQVRTGFHVTTPDSRRVQRLLRTIVNRGIKYLVLEATSHGLDQHRLLGCNFKIGVITNITSEHLDYHKTYANYLKAKAKLFQGTQYAVLNRDDKSYKYLYQRVTRPRPDEVGNQSTSQRVTTYGLSNADLTPKTFPFQTRLLGEHNQYNCLAAIAVARILKISDKTIKKALVSFQPVKGRLEEIKEGQKFKVFVDFAHTTGAFEKVIPTVRKLTKGEVIHVFGCTGDRDRTKRPIMGETAAKLSDKIILTHEDTYTEEPQKIIAEIEPGVKKGGKILGKTYWKALQRRDAIRQAIKMAKKDDTVLLTGVGHQTSLNLGGREVSWSDQEEARKAIRRN